MWVMGSDKDENRRGKIAALCTDLLFPFFLIGL